MTTSAIATRTKIRGVWGKRTCRGHAVDIGWVRCRTEDGAYYILKQTSFADLAAFIAQIKANGTVNLDLWTWEADDDEADANETTMEQEWRDANHGGWPLYPVA